MNSAIERLLTLRVRDVMNRRVVQVASQQTMTEAAGTFLEHAISGAPVVDQANRCVGVLSATDFVKRHVGRSMDRSQEQVVQHMSSKVQSIAADEPLMAAARLMCKEHIHRLPVLDSDRRLQGMVTSLDIVAALVNAIEE
jgi:CBS domain-containing membrane protein